MCSVDHKDGRSDDVDDEDDVDRLDLQCVSWLSFIEYYSVWSMLDLSLKRWSNSADASAAQCRFAVTPGPATYTVAKTIDWIMPMLVYSTHQLIICLWRRALKSGLLLLCGHTMHEQCIIAMRRCMMCYCSVRMICSQESFARSFSIL